MNTDIYCGIDGTGPESPAKYEEEFKNSFVQRMSKMAHWYQSFYERGPTLAGRETGYLGRQVAFFCKTMKELAEKQRRPNPRIFLSGFSRGGAAVLHAAQLLQKDDIEVFAVYLFDAVERSLGTDVDVIPGNVRHVFHAQRHWSSFSRLSFGNCGGELEDGSKTKQVLNDSFKCTHGAMGGTPHTKESGANTSYSVIAGKHLINENGTLMYSTNVGLEQEARESKRVWEWMMINHMTLQGMQLPAEHKTTHYA